MARWGLETIFSKSKSGFRFVHSGARNHGVTRVATEAKKSLPLTDLLPFEGVDALTSSQGAKAG